MMSDPHTTAGRVPGARYHDPDWLAEEQRHVFGKSWLVAGLAYRVSAPGRFFTFDRLGRSVIVVRDRAGTLRAFHNTCRHRGTRLVEGDGELSAIRCPYHAWTYGLDGGLQHVPGADGFSESVDRSRMGLLSVRVAEALGFVWVCFDAATPDLTATLGPIAEEVAPYRLEEMRPIQETSWTAKCNWKAILDNATEWYHNPVVHGESVHPLTHAPPDFVAHGDHCRQGLVISDYGWRRRMDEWTSRGGPYTEFQRAALQKYLLFPNFLMNLVPCHLTVFQVWPIDAETTEFFYGFYGRRGAGPLEWLRARATWAVSRYILREDWRILEKFQRGVATGQVAEHRMHAGETAIDHFHGVLDRRVGSGAASTRSDRAD